MPHGSRVRLPSLTGLRAIAAGLVVLHHVVFSGSVLVPVVSQVGTFGFVGVTFFFVLSGFVLTWSYPGITPAGAGHFYLRRFARVWPLHALMMIVALDLARFGGWEVPWSSIGLAIPLLQAWVPSVSVCYCVNLVTWSLSAEVFFYACFPLLLPRIRRVRRCGWAMAAIWGVNALMVAAVLFALARVPVGAMPPAGIASAQEYLLYNLPVARLGEFVTGMLLARAIQNGWRLPSRPGRTVAVALLIATGVLTGLSLASDRGAAGVPVAVTGLVVLPPVVVIVAAAVTVDLRAAIEGLPGPLTSAGWQRMGGWSFALFISHQLVISTVIEVAGVGTAQLTFAVVLAIALSGLLHRWVEEPLHTAIVTVAERYSRRGVRQAHSPRSGTVIPSGIWTSQDSAPSGSSTPTMVPNGVPDGPPTTVPPPETTVSAAKAASVVAK